MLSFKIGDKFKDDHDRELEIIEITDDQLEPYVLSFYDYNQWNVSSYSEQELMQLEQIK